MIIDIGSGPHPKMDADVRMDLHNWPEVNCLHDLTVTPYPFKDAQFKKAYMGDVIEHIYIFDIDRVLREVNRILEPNGIFEVTVPDCRWIFERIVNNDWNQKANVSWLNPTNSQWKNAMSYLFGGFQNINEYKISGMGHVTGFDEFELRELLEKNGFYSCRRVPDLRNPEPARDSVIKMICIKR